MEAEDIRFVGNSLCLVDVIGCLRQESQTTAGALLGRWGRSDISRSRFPAIFRLWNSGKVKFGKRGPGGAAIQSHEDLCLCIQELWYYCRITHVGSSSSMLQVFLTKYKCLQDLFLPTGCLSKIRDLWGAHAAIWPDRGSITGDVHVSAPPATPDSKVDAQTPDCQEDTGVAPSQSVPTSSAESPSQPPPQDLIDAVTKACSTVLGCKPPAVHKDALAVKCPRERVGEFVDRVGLYTDSKFVRRSSGNMLLGKGYNQYRCQFGRKPTYMIKKIDNPTNGCEDAQVSPQDTVPTSTPSVQLYTATSQVSASSYTAHLLGASLLVPKIKRGTQIIFFTGFACI
jgi:hypothetical protein